MYGFTTIWCRLMHTGEQYEYDYTPTPQGQVVSYKCGRCPRRWEVASPIIVGETSAEVIERARQVPRPPRCRVRRNRAAGPLTMTVPPQKAWWSFVGKALEG